MRRSLILSVLVCSPLLAAPGQTEPPADSELGAEGAWAFRRDHLEGPDELLGSVAALNLCQAAGSPEPSKKIDRKRHLDFVREKLDPRAFLLEADGGPGPEAFRVSRRILEAATALTVSGSPPFPETGDLLYQLLGRGPDKVRGLVVGALVALIDSEERRGQPGRPGASRLKEEVASRIAHNPPPEGTVLQDASRVLWRSDGKRFIEAAIAGMDQNREKHIWSTELYLREIRRRLRIDFESPEGWGKWWASQKERTFPEIFADCQRRISERSAYHWREVMRQLRDAQEVERVLVAIQATLSEARGIELRLAAVALLGDFGAWVRDVKLPEVTGGDPDAGDPRDRLLARAFLFLLEVAEGKSRPHEDRQVKRAALMAMRKYQSFLDARSELLEPVTQLIAPRLEAAIGQLPSIDDRAELLEVLHTAGALGLSAVREQIEALLKLLAHDLVDLEVSTAATVALGRLVRSQLRGETAELFITLFDFKGDAEQQSQIRDLHRACVNALNARPENEDVRKKVRRFYRKILDQKTDELRIPAILGLGILAQDKDSEALEMLVDVVAKPKSFKAQEIIAALDAIAYVGGREALHHVLRNLGARDQLVQKDQAVYEHLWGKAVSLVKAERGSDLSFAIARLEELAMSQDSLLFLECVYALSREPELEQAFSTQGAALGDQERLREVWVVVLARARASELVGPKDRSPEEKEDLSVSLEKLSDLQRKNPEVDAKIPTEAEQLKSFVEGKTKREALVAKLGEAGSFGPVAITEEWSTLVEAQRSPWERWFAFRWIEKQLGILAHKSPGSLDAGAVTTLAATWAELVTSDAKAGLFEGLAPQFKTRYTERLGALKTAGPPTESPPKE